MIDETLKNEILQQIELEGSADEESRNINLIIASRSQGKTLLHLHSGLPKLKPSVIDKFSLVLSQGNQLRALSALSIRCCLCGKIISYPAWHYQERMAVNWINYFICFDRKHSTVTANCFRRLV